MGNFTLLKMMFVNFYRQCHQITSRKLLYQNTMFLNDVLKNPIAYKQKTYDLAYEAYYDTTDRITLGIIFI